MYCTICQSHGKVNTFTKGTNNYKTTTLDRHAKSKVHQAALLDKKTQHDMVKTIATALSQKEQSVIKALQTVYYMAKTDVANHKYQETLEWLEYMGIAELSHISSGKNATYTSHHIMEEMQDAIAKVITKQIDERITNSPFVTILVDESTDITINKKLCVYARLLNTSTMAGETVFLQNVQLASGDATAIHGEIGRVMAEHQITKRKVIGLGSDGASVSNINYLTVHCCQKYLNIYNLQSTLYTGEVI